MWKESSPLCVGDMFTRSLMICLYIGLNEQHKTCKRVKEAHLKGSTKIKVRKHFPCILLRRDYMKAVVINQKRVHEQTRF